MIFFVRYGIRLLCILLPVWLFYRFTKRRPGTSMVRETWLTLFFIYCVLLFTLTLFPLPNTYWMDPETKLLNLKPFVFTWQELKASLHSHNRKNILLSFENIFGNAILLAPFGFFMPLLFPSMRTFGKTMLYAVAVTVGIETIQFLAVHIHIYRVADIDDVILNTAGAAAGYAFFQVLRPDRWFHGTAVAGRSL